MPLDWSPNHSVQSHVQRGNTLHHADTVVVLRDVEPMPGAIGSGYRQRHQRLDPNCRKLVGARVQVVANVDGDVECGWSLPEGVLVGCVEERGDGGGYVGGAKRDATSAATRIKADEDTKDNEINN